MIGFAMSSAAATALSCPPAALSTSIARPIISSTRFGLAKMADDPEPEFEDYEVCVTYICAINCGCNLTFLFAFDCRAARVLWQ